MKNCINMMRNWVVLVGACLAVFGFAHNALAQLNVMTTLSDLDAIVREIGGDDVSSSSFCKGTQDPHYIEPKPSYMIKASKADLVVSIGLGLEVGWLPSIIQGARNPKIVPGNPGFLEVGPLLDPLEVPSGKVTRAEGDVHPEGNPHVTLDPIRAGTIAIAIAERMAELDPPHGAKFRAQGAALQQRLAEKTKLWQARIVKSGITKVITFHKTLTYFFDRFQLKNPAILEPLPGVPPTARHTLEVIAKAQSEKVQLILVENFFDPTVADRVAKDVPGLRVVSVPVNVGGDDAIHTLDDLYENLVHAVEGGSSHV